MFRFLGLIKAGVPSYKCETLSTVTGSGNRGIIKEGRRRVKT
jgi:hypothetical protein